MPRQRIMTAVYLLDGDHMLLLKRQGSSIASGTWIGAAGGHMEPEEVGNARACVLRELREETGLQETKLQNLQLRYITLRHTKGEIRVNHYFFADLPGGQHMELSSNEGELRWFRRDELSSLTMPYSAYHMIAHYLACGQHNSQMYVGTADGERVVFTPLPPT